MESKTAESEVLLYEQNFRKDMTSLCFTQTFWIEGQGQIQSDQCNDSKIGAFLLQKNSFYPLCINSRWDKLSKWDKQKAIRNIYKNPTIYNMIYRFAGT